MIGVELLAMSLEVALVRKPSRTLRTAKRNPFTLLQMRAQMALQHILSRKGFTAMLTHKRTRSLRIRA